MPRKSGGAFAVASVLALAIVPLVADAQSQTAGSNTVPLATVVTAVAKRSDKKFIIDPRVSGDVLLLKNPEALTYDDLLMILQVHGFAAVTNGDYVRVIPDAGVRQLALPVVGDEKHGLAEYVTRIVHVNNIPAAMLVPILRPLLPQNAHLVAMPCTNDLVMVDTFGNVQRLEKVIKSLDRGAPITPPNCSASELASTPAKPGKD